MDYQNAPQPQPPQATKTFGRFDPAIGAPVDDATKTVFARGLGWVNAKGDVFTGGKWFPAEAHGDHAQPLAQEFAAKARMLQQRSPVADQMRATTAQVTAPAAPAPAAPSLPATPPQPHHKLAADSFKHLLGALT